MQILSVSIDLKKIDKSRIKAHKNGALYYEMQIFINDEKDKYGQDVSVSDNQTKEEREAKVKKTYLGNGKVIYTSSAPPAPASSSTVSFDGHDSGDNSLPF